MKTVAIIQARMSSTRLPGKVLKTVQGRPLLSMMCERIKKAKTIDEMVVATSADSSDDIIEEFCKENSLPVVRGDLHDVLARYHKAAELTGADVVVRLTADCPLIDPSIIDAVVEFRNKNKLDYAANTAPPEGVTFPDGMDVEVFTKAALERAYVEASDKAHREHVTFYFWKNPGLFKCGRMDSEVNLSNYRLTVDYPQDFELIEKIFEHFHRHSVDFGLHEIISYLNDNQSLLKLNGHILRNQGWKT